MTNLNRRDAVKAAAALAAGVGPAPRAVIGADQSNPAPDRELELAITSPQGYMLSEPVTFKLNVEGPSRDLHITSALDSQGKSSLVYVPTYSMRIFRADTTKDAFTQQGGIYWRHWKTEGKIQLKEPGAVVMLVRENDTVRCYTLSPDERC